MKESSANLLREGKQIIRSIGDVCDASCVTWFCCSNSKPNGTCTGFIVMNGKSRVLLDRNMSECDIEYVQNCVQTVQRGADPETEKVIVKEVLRYVSSEPTQRPSGISYMVQCALGVSNNPTATAEVEPETRGTSGFLAQLSASTRGNGEQPSRIEKCTGIRVFQPMDFEAQLPQICSESCPIKRHCSSFPAQIGNLCVKVSEQYKNKERIVK